MATPTATTIVGAVKADEPYVTLANQAALKPGDNIVCEQESMRAIVVGAGAAVVYRGARGTAGKAHAAGTAATYGAPSDYGAGPGVAVAQMVGAEGEGEGAPVPLTEPAPSE